MTRTNSLIVFAVLAMWAVPLYLDWRVAIGFFGMWVVAISCAEYYDRQRYAKRIAELKARANRC